MGESKRQILTLQNPLDLSLSIDISKLSQEGRKGEMNFESYIFIFR